MTATDLTVHTHSALHFDKPFSCDSKLDDSFAKIDWQAPWLCHLNQLSYVSKTISRLSSSCQQVDTAAEHDNQADIAAPDIIAKVLNTAMLQQNNKSQQPSQTKPTPNNHAHRLRFVSQDALPEGEAYESFIATTGNIPTRDNLHDLFNGSIWLTFPKTKALLNYYHMCEIAKKGISTSRGRVRDTITVFDENGAVLVTTEPSIGEALIDFDWQASLITPRECWDNPQQISADDKNNAKAAVYIFGHALLEKLLQPRKPLCAHSVIIYVSAEFFKLKRSERIEYLDNQLAEYMHDLLSREDVTPRKLSPLPILGVPHFWAENANPSFYEDNQVFRSGRRQKV
ncbi:DUF3025 domain-containing protein [Psychrobacter sp. DAB_AL32B]|uniref:DUF3025 domain-containing protein n=1 Tax=Psychrobacter sp. DAB_AL32B TaxID=1028414 RepID=UPI000B7D7450|nr:DUF3025 domain-containing protein [Psychrobacter sp. DAB_AL32B]OXL18105.1 hypothetical protein CAN34_12795 [Psychrobacter sp. DAB_AL32B]